jgi:hypothetical protein
MTFQEKLTQLKEKNSQIYKIKKEIKEMSSDIFEDFQSYIFDKYPKLESFGWTQYTPYFNDGESCMFYANTDYLTINGENADGSEWFCPITITNNGTWNRELRIYEGREEEKNLNYDQNMVDACGEIGNFLSNFDDDFYLSRFGDHAEITVTKSEIEISDYDHE